MQMVVARHARHECTQHAPLTLTLDTRHYAQVECGSGSITNCMRMHTIQRKRAPQIQSKVVDTFARARAHRLACCARQLHRRRNGFVSQCFACASVALFMAVSRHTHTGSRLSPQVRQAKSDTNAQSHTKAKACPCVCVRVKYDNSLGERARAREGVAWL